MPLVRELQATIFQQGWGGEFYSCQSPIGDGANHTDYTDIMGSVDNYGEYEVLGNLTVNVANLSSSSSYRRSLDLSTGVHTVTYEANGATFIQ